MSGKYQKTDVYTGDDVRRVITRFTPENMEANQPLLFMLQRFAEQKHATPAQISLAWMLHKYSFVVPIPGMRKEERLKENFGAAYPYAGYIRYFSKVHGQVNAEIEEYVKQQLIAALFKFRFDR